MSSIIITQGLLKDPMDPLGKDPDDRNAFRLGMLKFGQVFRSRFSAAAADDASRAKALVDTFIEVIGTNEGSTTGYYGYFLRENGRARQIYNPRLRDETSMVSRERYVLLFTHRRKNNTEGNYRIIARPDKTKRMHVSLPSIADVSSYLQVTNAELKNLAGNEANETDFLLANTLISRCK